jgi:hypothetical protein
MSYILDRSLPGRYVDLRAMLTKGATGPLTFVDDCLLSGTQAEHMISELLAARGKGKRPVKYYEPLTKTERQRLQGRPLKFVFGVGTDAGRARFRRFLDQSGLQHDVLIGREVALLSERGRTAREEGRLLDASGSVRDPLASLAAPLFSPFERVWPRGRRWEDAREFCQRVGYAILDRRAEAAGWSDERRHGSALGFSGFQGRLVFGHNVPKTTLTLLWEHGVFEGRAWVPLFPSRE